MRLLAGCCLLTIAAQAVTMKSFFLGMPAVLLPTLPVSARNDLVDFFENNQRAEVPALFNNSCVLSAFGNDYLRLETSSVSNIQIKRLPVADSSVFLLINTVNGPLSDSRARLFTSEWKEVKGFAMPEIYPRMLLDASRVSEEEMDRFDRICRFFVGMNADPSAPEVRVTVFINDEVPPELLLSYKDLYSESLTLTWTGEGFRFEVKRN